MALPGGLWFERGLSPFGALVTKGPIGQAEDMFCERSEYLLVIVFRGLGAGLVYIECM